MNFLRVIGFDFANKFRPFDIEAFIKYFIVVYVHLCNLENELRIGLTCKFY